MWSVFNQTICEGLPIDNDLIGNHTTGNDPGKDVE